MKQIVNGILLLYEQHITIPNAATVTENIESFENHSVFPVWSYNTDLGFPSNLRHLNFDIIVLHYSLFAIGSYYALSQEFLDYIHNSSSYKIAFFQDDYRYCQKRFQFINTFNINTVYTPLQSENIPKVYGANTKADYVYSYLCGYVSKDLVEKTQNFVKPHHKRSIDISYRARQLPYYLGSGGQEKHLIGLQFIEECEKNNLKFNLDIKINFDDRIYGNNWYRFLGDSRGVLGVESGGSIVDLEDEAVNETQLYLEKNPQASFDEVYKALLYKYDNNISYRVSSPRIFESAALKCVMIMYEGNYSGLVKPDIHYIALKKDFSNFEQVIQKFNNPEYCNELIERAYQDLITSGNYTYEAFLKDFDQHLKERGIIPNPDFQRKKIDNWFKNTIKSRTRIRYMFVSAKLYAEKYLSKNVVLWNFFRGIYRRIKPKKNEY